MRRDILLAFCAAVWLCALPNQTSATFKMSCPKSYLQTGTGTCIRIVHRRLPRISAVQKCLRDGAKLYVVPSLSAISGLLKIRGLHLKGRILRIGGSYSMRNLATVSETERRLIYAVASRYKKTVTSLGRSCDGRLSASRLAAPGQFCLFVHVSKTLRIGVGSCSTALSFICAIDSNWDREEVVKTEWFSFPSRERTLPYDRESYDDYRRYRKGQKGAVLCERPLGCECRRKGSTTILQSGQSRYCRLEDKNCKFQCGRCGDYEMRVVCPKPMSCNLTSMVEACQQQNKDCQDSATGARCVDKPSDPPSFSHHKCLTADFRSVNVRKCSATGDPHYTTFDGKKYNFQGKCCYHLVKMCKSVPNMKDLSIIVCNDNPFNTRAVSWTRSVRISYGDLKIFLSRDKCLLNSVEIQGYYQGKDVTITRRAKRCRRRVQTYVVITAGDCLKIEWDGRTNLHVSLSEAYSNALCGLCGNMNGNPVDDLQGHASAIAMGISYLAYDPSYTPSACKSTLPEPKCDPAVKAKYTVDKFCGLLRPTNYASPFRQIVNKFKATEDLKYLQRKYEDCLVDHCENDGQKEEFIKDDITCTFLSEVAQQFLRLRRGPFPTSPSWRLIAGCDEDCSKDNNTAYDTNKRSCENTCKRRSAEVNCGKEPGCACKDGFIRDGLSGACIPEDDCQKHCFNVRKDPEDAESDAVDLANGQSLLLEPCVRKVLCVDGQARYENLTRCDSNAKCMAGGRCVCNPGFKGNGYSCAEDVKKCRAGFTRVGRNCYKLVVNRKTWYAASLICCAHHAQLARVDSLADFADLKAYLAMVSGRLTSLRAEELWVAGNTLTVGANQMLHILPTSSHKSAFLELENQATKLGCYYSLRSGQQAISTNCYLPRLAVCGYANPNTRERPSTKIEPRFILAHRRRLTFSQCKVRCHAKGRPLPSIKTFGQLLAFSRFCKKKDAWMDFQDQGRNLWRWGDGSKVTRHRRFWSAREPDYIGIQKCGRLHHDGRRKGFRFRSTRCNRRSAYCFCGKRAINLPHVWSPFIKVPGTARTAATAILRERRKTNFICRSPAAVECRVLDSETKAHVSASVNPNTRCSVGNIRCRPSARYPCSTFQVRFFCPNEQNMCLEMKKAKGTNPCPGGKVCLPRSNGCFDCQCPSGFQQDSNFRCVKPCGLCRLSGDPHFRTFQGIRFDFMGTCQYLFNGICPFARGKLPTDVLAYDILTRYYNCNPKRKTPVSCLRSFTIRFYNADGNGKTLTIFKDKSWRYFLVDKVTARKTYYVLKNKAGKTLVKATFGSNVFSLKAYGGLAVEAVTHRLTVQPPAGMRDEMCGLCGHCLPGVHPHWGDGTKAPLSLTKRGKVASTSAWKFGNSWLRSDATDVGKPCEGQDLTPPPPQPTCDPTVEAAAKAKCGLMASEAFKDCHPHVQPGDYVSECVFDACADTPQDVCRMIKVYADKCSTKGHPVDWRGLVGCEMKCPDETTMEYAYNVNCQRQCSSMGVKKCATAEHSDGCKCKEGLFEQGGACVSEEQCGCSVDMLVDGREVTEVLQPGEEIFNKDCTKKIRCIKDGNTVEVAHERDPNSVCKPTTPPSLVCAEGFAFNNATNACQRNPKECKASQDFVLVGGRCVKVAPHCRLWRQAALACNNVNATLMRVDVMDKLDGLKALMKKDAGMDAVYIGGQVVVKRDGSIAKLLPDDKQKKIAYANFAVSNFILQRIQGPTGVLLSSLPAQGAVFAVGAFYDRKADKVTVRAVSRLDCLKAACEERTDPPGTYVPTPYCSGHNPTFKGEIERVSMLLQDPECKMCPHPTSVKCKRASSKAKGVVRSKKCKNRNNVLYSCRGRICADVKVSGKCPPDVDECKEGLHDCAPDQTCQNSNGAYHCHCHKARPLMVKGKCQTIETCTIKGSKGLDLSLMPFTAIRPGKLGYDCQMRFAGVCEDITDKDVSLFDILVDNKKEVTRSVQTVTVQVSTAKGNSTFVFPHNLMRVGKFKFNDAVREKVSFSDPVTGVKVVRGGRSVLLHEKDRRFQVLVAFSKRGVLKKLKVHSSGQYRDKLCGLCTMGTSARYHPDTPPFHKQVRVGSRACEAMTPPTSSSSSPPPPPPPSSESTPPVNGPTTAPPPPPPTAAEPCTVDVESQSNHRYKKVRIPKPVAMGAISGFTFAVRGCSGAHMILSKGGKKTLNRGKDLLEIVLGAEGNSKSVIRTQKGKPTSRVAQVRHPVAEGPLSCQESRMFYLSWAQGLVRVGKVGSGPFLSYKLKRAIDVRHVFVAGVKGKNPALKWTFKFPCGKPPVKPPPPTAPDTCKGNLPALSTKKLGKVRPPKRVNMRQVSYITFSVKGCQAAYIILSEKGRRVKDGDAKRRVYKVLLGSGINKKVAVLVGKRKNQKKLVNLARRTDKRRLLKCKKKNKFNLSWKGGKIQLRRAGSRKPLLSFQTGYAGFSPKRIYVDGGPKTKKGYRFSRWKIQFPCAKPPPTPPTTTTRPPPPTTPLGFSPPGTLPPFVTTTPTPKPPPTTPPLPYPTTPPPPSPPPTTTPIMLPRTSAPPTTMMPPTTAPPPPTTTPRATPPPTTPTTFLPTTPAEVTVPSATAFPDTCTVTRSIPAVYDYQEMPLPQGVRIKDISSITFSVKACKEAHLVISKGAKASLEQGAGLFEIAIGYSSNTRSAIRDKKQGQQQHVLDTFDHGAAGPLSCDQERSFTLSWADGNIQVTAQNSKTPFLSYKSGKGNIEVNHVFVSGREDPSRTMEWKIDFPCTKPPKDECVKETQLCTMLSSRCNTELSKCLAALCDRKMPLCDYLFATTFKCRIPLKNTDVQKLAETCQKKCRENQVVRLWPETGEKPSCADKDAQPDAGDATVDLKFTCLCNQEKGFYYENDKCVPASDCGCVVNNSDYKPLNDKWTAEDCSKDFTCQKVEDKAQVVAKERQCDKASRCVKNGDGQSQCVCADGKGVPDMPGGCSGVPETNQTCYLKGTDKELCICNKGFAPTCDGCQDINECAMEDNVCTRRGERCVNLVGSFLCACQKGYRRNSNQKCVDDNECITKNKPCERAGKGAYCVNYIGTYGCECCAGYDLINSKCVRNTQRIPVLSPTAQCCMCPKGWKECLKTPGGADSAGCYRNALGYYAQYRHFRDMYEDQCLRGEGVDPQRWVPGPCPTKDATTLPPQGSPQPTSPAPGFTPSPTPSPTPRKECDKNTACDKFPTPPSLEGSEVCGPPGRQEQTHSSYCNMLIAMCRQAGGPSNFSPPSSPSAKKGPCPTTTPPPTTTASTLASLEFTEWTPWSPCTALDPTKDCGVGRKTRTRQAKAGQPRDPLPSELEDSIGCIVACPTTTPAPVDTTTAPQTTTTTTPPLVCKDIGSCENAGQQVVCGQIGTDNPDTFPSQCHLDVLACNRRQPAHKLYNGQCDPADKGARRYCNDTVTKIQREHVKPGRPDCKVTVPVGNCENRLCREGNVNFCCQPAETQLVPIKYLCAKGEEEDGLLESATKCVCKLKEPQK